MALTRVIDWNIADPEDRRASGIKMLAAKGVGDDNVYILEVDPVTGFFPVAPITSSFGWGDPSTGARTGAMVATYQELPTPGAGANGLTGTLVEKSIADDGQALDATLWGYDSVSGTYKRVHVSQNNNIPIAGLVPEDWKGLTATYPSTTQEVFTYYQDAAKANLICTITVDYTDTSKQFISSVTRT